MEKLSPGEPECEAAAVQLLHVFMPFMTLAENRQPLRQETMKQTGQQPEMGEKPRVFLNSYRKYIEKSNNSKRFTGRVCN